MEKYDTLNEQDNVQVLL